jgi:hypothetical protein
VIEHHDIEIIEKAAQKNHENICTSSQALERKVFENSQINEDAESLSEG